MNNNRQFLKEAIADAKTVKDSAIANAKASLEEAFGTKLKSMLATKLEEMDDEENIDLSETQNEEEEINLDEMLAELEKADDDEKKINEEEGEEEESLVGTEDDEEIDLENASDEELTDYIEKVIADMVESGELEAGENFQSEEGEGEEFNLGTGEEMEGVESEEEETEITETTQKEPSDSAAAGAEAILNSVKSLAKKSPEFMKKLKDIMAELGKSASYAIHRESQDLKEALKTVKILKKEFNTVNLLNSKLIYNNKIMNENVLSKTQKLKVVSAFDKAKTTKEVKMVYDILKENLKNSTAKKPTNIQERVLHGASKVIKSTNTKPRIVESDQMVERFQKLAGITKN